MAMDQVNVEIVTREVIKPSSPTLNHLRKFNLSLLDLPAPVSYEPLVFLYSNFQQQLTGTQKSQRLKRSLSVTLTRFYPLAGRIKDGFSIECNDFGAVFVESRVSCLLSKFLEKPDAELLGKFIPVGTESPETLTGSLVLVQANFFACGGLAIGACISQRVADPVTFIKAWAAAALGSVDDTAVDLTSDKCVTKRVVFDASKTAALQAKAASESVTCPTRVEAVTALIWKCAMNASRSSSEHIRYSILSQSVDLRKRMAPPLPENTIGNLVGLLRFMCDGVRDRIAELGRPATARAAGFHGRRQGFHGYQANKNAIIIMDARDGRGVEAWVTLTEEDMTFFERDRELLAAASFDPNALDLIMPNSSL
ncbi:N-BENZOYLTRANSFERASE PROTEIN putative-RELATED [Salix viminalis]|uniref:N-BENZOYLTRANSFERASE PROTEIN putative-RELATED n=1 Tax=Salix viminalis TaxID=40686 RepID=A0A9Q0Z576_SALVM|nr:N-BENZOYLTRANSFERASE PROTEIN putative-RELATED [Salix viminalis]